MSCIDLHKLLHDTDVNTLQEPLGDTVSYPLQ